MLGPRSDWRVHHVTLGLGEALPRRISVAIAGHGHWTRAWTRLRTRCHGHDRLVPNLSTSPDELLTRPLLPGYVPFSDSALGRRRACRCSTSTRGCGMRSSHPADPPGAPCPDPCPRPCPSAPGRDSCRAFSRLETAPPSGVRLGQTGTAAAVSALRTADSLLDASCATSCTADGRRRVRRS